MMQARDIASSVQLPAAYGGFVADHGAPWLNLIGTVLDWHADEPVDLLESPSRLRDWLELHQLAPRRAPSEQDLAEVREVRAALRELAASVVERREPHGNAVTVVNRLIAEETVGARLGYDSAVGGFVLRRPLSVTAGMVWLARTAVCHLTGPEAEQLRICGADDCTRIFLDTNGRRHWCPGGRCGNRARVRAHRARAG